MSTAKAYDDFISKLAPHLRDGWVSQDPKGTEIAPEEPALVHSTGMWWNISNKRGEPNNISNMFVNIPQHPDSRKTLRHIVDGNVVA